MHVGLDLVFLEPGRSGGRETYARELLRGLRAVAPGLTVTTFCNRETAAAGPGWWTELADDAVLLARAGAASRAAWALGELAALPRAAARRGVDVLHSPANFGPIAGAGARVLTVHDALWRVVPDAVSPALRAGTDVLVRAAARRARAVITVSQASRADLVAHVGLDAERIAVVPNGLAPIGTAAPAAGPPVALAVATDLPHKDLATVVDAIAAIAPERRPPLVVAGHGTDSGALPERVARAGIDARLLGAVGPQALEGLYARAAVLVTATRHEGFGLPVLEAMARGVPVVCTDLPVLHEVAGDAALYAPARSPQRFAEAIDATLRGGRAVEERVAAGRSRAARFTWEAAARATLAVYERSATTNTRFV